MSRSCCRSRGFTLVELLVVIAIIGMLVALLLPAVQAAREAARRSQCQNNLKQMALAMHAYEGSYRKLPSALMGGISSNADDGYGWAVALLPFTEQQGLYEKLDAAMPLGTPRALGLYSSANGGKTIPGGETRLTSYRCPSSPLPDVVPASFSIPGGTGSLATNRTLMTGYATSDYKGAGGSCHGDDGVLHKLAEAPQNRRWSDITDGLSQTLLIGESSYVSGNNIWPSVATKFDDWPIWIGGPGTDESVRFNGRTTAPINCGCTPGTMIKALSDDCSFSFHAHGAQFVMCDGSVKFISENISITTFCNLNAINDGVTVNDF